MMSNQMVFRTRDGKIKVNLVRRMSPALPNNGETHTCYPGGQAYSRSSSISWRASVSSSRTEPDRPGLTSSRSL